jgi:DNA ligase-1
VTKAQPKFVHVEDVRDWYAEAPALSEYVRSIGAKQLDDSYVDAVLGMPLHMRFVVEKRAAENEEPLARNAFDSIPFYSLCRGLFLPLSGLAPDRIAQIFGIAVPPDYQLDTAGREALLRDFLAKEIGITLPQKLGCVLGDPFLGRRSSMQRDSLLRLLGSVTMWRRSDMLDRLTVVGDVAHLFAESRHRLRETPPLTAAEVLEVLRLFPGERRLLKFDILRSLLSRCGKLEAYFLAKLLLRKAGFGFDYQGPLLARSLAEHFKADQHAVGHAIALTDIFHVARVLMAEGPEALRRIQLQPLVPVRPALASGTTDEIKQYPVFVERKYDGIRLMLHKSTDARGGVLCGAYTRNRHDWLELVAGLDATVKMLPARSVILDGELYGTILDMEGGARPASVYDVYSALQGERTGPINLKFAAFDLIYRDGHDLTRLPLSERRKHLQMLVGPLAGAPLPVPMTMSEGQVCGTKDDVNRLYGHFRAQGYEGIIAKDLDGPYALGERDASWRKRKPEVTLDLVLLGAVLAVTTKEHAGRFGSYVIGAKNETGGFKDVGDVAGVDRARDLEIQHEILREGLITGRRIERPSASGVRPGFELRPHIVATVRFEGITKDTVTGELKLRDPKLVVIRGDKGAAEADGEDAIRELYLASRVG